MRIFDSFKDKLQDISFSNEKKAVLLSLLVMILIIAIALPLSPFKSKAGIPPRSFFVDSVSGNDSNSGLSKATPWRTLSKVNTTLYNPGDVIYFKKGSTFNGTLNVTSSGSSTQNIVYTTYGEGAKPIITGAVRSTSPWVTVSPNVYSTTITYRSNEGTGYANIGNLLFNGAQSVGIKRYSVADLTKQGDFYFSRSRVTTVSPFEVSVTGKVYLYSTSSPSVYYKTIDFVTGSSGVKAREKSNFRVSGLDVRAMGVHGFNIAFGNNINISGNDVSWIGGAQQEGGCPTCTGQTRLGNGIQVSGCSNVLIEKNRLWEIFDGAISAEYSSPTTAMTIQNINVRNNLIWNSDEGLAFWIRPAASVAKNIVFENNTILDSGKGWGNDTQRAEMIKVNPSGNASRAVGFMASYSEATQKELTIRNNVFANSLKSNVRISNRDLSWIRLDNNYYINQTGNIAKLDLTNYIAEFNPSQSREWQQQTGKDTKSIFTTNAVALINSNLLPAGSPAINAGQANSIKSDFLGNPIIGLPDLGAFEYQP